MLLLRFGGPAASSDGVDMLVCALGRLAFALLLALPSPFDDESVTPFEMAFTSPVDRLPPGNCDCQALAP